MPFDRIPVSPHTEQHKEQIEFAKEFEQQWQQLNAVFNQTNFGDLFDKYDVPLDDITEPDIPAPERKHIDKVARSRKSGEAVKHVTRRAVELERAVKTTSAASRPGLRVLEHSDVDQRRSAPGTPIIDGTLEVETNSRYDHATVRGYLGDPGLYDEYWRQSGIIRDAMQSNTEPLVSGSYGWHDVPDEHIPMSKRSAYEEWSSWWRARTGHLLLDAQGGSDAIEHDVHHVQKTGFSVQEYEWYEDDKGLYPGAVHPIECSSVYEWMLQDGMRGLTGCNFDPGSYGDPYTLTYEGERLTDYKLHLANVAAYNNNFEGVSPMRPSLFLIRLKQLLLRIIGVGVEGFGVPIKEIGYDSDALAQIASNESVKGADITDEKKRTEFFNVIKRIRAVDRNTYTKPFGIAMNILSADGAFPAVVLDVLQYLDTLMAMPYSNEGGFLGLQSSVGSYKLGEIKDKQDLSSAFYFARRILKPWNRLTRVSCRRYVGELPKYPFWGYQLDGLTDNSRWTDDAVKVFGGTPATQWPEEVKRTLEQKMELPEGALDAEEEADTTDDQLMYKMTNAVSNGVIAVTPELVRFAYSILGAPEPSESAVQKAVEQWGKMAQPDRTAPDTGAPEVEQMLQQTLQRDGLRELAASLHHAADEERDGEHDHTGTVILEHVAEHATLLEHAEQQFDAERAERVLDDFEDEIADEFRSIAWEQKTEWGRDWNDAITSNDIDADAVEASVSRYRKKYLPRYTAAARAILTKAAQEGMAAQLAEFVDVGDDFAGELSETTKQQIKLRADSMAREMFNRSHGMLVDRMGEFEQGDGRVGLDVPKKSTIASQIAPRGTSSAFNRGRTQVQTDVKARAEIEGLKGQAYATRLAILDKATCDVCERLDGTSVIVGSKQYYNIQPPNKCEGRHRCRCMYVLTMSNNSDSDGFERVMQKIRDNSGQVAL